MGKKLLAILTIATMSLSLAACGNTNDANIDSVDQPSTESIIETTEEPTEEIIEEPTEFTTSSEGTHIEGVNSEDLTVKEVTALDNQYVRDKYNNWPAFEEYAASKGADDTMGIWMIYYYGYGAGDQRSYAYNERTGETIIAGPNTYFYGGPGQNGEQAFYGGDLPLPGEEHSEYIMNQLLKISSD